MRDRSRRALVSHVALAYGSPVLWASLITSHQSLLSPRKRPGDFAATSPPAISTDMSTKDTRSPCPPYGYSCDCQLPVARQIELVAEFHAYRIRPTRIAYRLGIDIALIDALLAGEHEPQRFEALVRKHRQRRFRQRVRDSERLRGQGAYEQREQAIRDLQTQPGI